MPRAIAGGESSYGMPQGAAVAGSGMGWNRCAAISALWLSARYGVEGRWRRLFVQHTGQRVRSGRGWRGLRLAAESLRGHVVAGAHRHTGLGQALLGDCRGDAGNGPDRRSRRGSWDVFRFECGASRRSACAASSAAATWRAMATARGGQRPLAVRARPRRALDEAHVDKQLAVDLAVVVDGTTWGSCKGPAVWASRCIRARNTDRSEAGADISLSGPPGP